MGPQKKMLIDALPPLSPRPEQMEVLTMGFARTGTMSLQKGLETLGLKSYHTLEAGKTKTFPYWLEAVRAKMRAKDDLLDLPCYMFVDELLAAYPNAKVIITQRDVDSWLRSMDKTLLRILSWKSFHYIAPFEPVSVGPYWKPLNHAMDFCTGGNLNDRQKLVQTFHDHYDHVRRVVPKEKLFEFNPSGGYESLCEFLDKPVPKGENYPHTNTREKLMEDHVKIWWYTLTIAVKKIGMNLGAVAIPAGAIWYYSYKM